MAFTRNAVPPHLAKRNCRQCKLPTLALNRKTGRIEDHPLCPECQKEFDTQFRQAQRQRNVQLFHASKKANEQARQRAVRRMVKEVREKTGWVPKNNDESFHNPENDAEALRHKYGVDG